MIVVVEIYIWNFWIRAGSLTFWPASEWAVAWEMARSARCRHNLSSSILSNWKRFFKWVFPINKSFVKRAQLKGWSISIGTRRSKIRYSIVGWTGAFTMLAEPVIALTVELAAKVMRISLLFFRYCRISQVSAIRFAFNSSSSVMPPFIAAVATTDKPPDKMRLQVLLRVMNFLPIVVFQRTECCFYTHV